MRKLALFMHVSLDGFVAGPNGEMDWISISDELFDYARQRTAEADMALYGRGTYELMESYWPTAADKPNATKHDKEHSQWYAKVHKIVLSRTMKNPNSELVQIFSENVVEEVEKIKAGGDKDIVIFGSPGASKTLMEANVIDEYWLCVNSVMIGEGIPLFPKLKHKIALELIGSKTISSKVVCLHYKKIPGQ